MADPQETQAADLHKLSQLVALQQATIGVNALSAHVDRRFANIDTPIPLIHPAALPMLDQQAKKSGT